MSDDRRSQIWAKPLALLSKATLFSTTIFLSWNILFYGSLYLRVPTAILFFYLFYLIFTLVFFINLILKNKSFGARIFSSFVFLVLLALIRVWTFSAAPLSITEYGFDLYIEGDITMIGLVAEFSISLVMILVLQLTFAAAVALESLVDRHLSEKAL